MKTDVDQPVFSAVAHAFSLWVFRATARVQQADAFGAVTLSSGAVKKSKNCQNLEIDLNSVLTRRARTHSERSTGHSASPLL